MSICNEIVVNVGNINEAYMDNVDTATPEPSTSGDSTTSSDSQSDEDIDDTDNPTSAATASDSIDDSTDAATASDLAEDTADMYSVSLAPWSYEDARISSKSESESDEAFDGVHNTNYIDDVDDIVSVATAPDAVENIDDIDIAALAPYAPETSNIYSESVGEILTQESWRKVLANVPRDKALQTKRFSRRIERRSHAPEVMFEDALGSEDDNTAISGQVRVEADDIYGGTPRPVAEDDNSSSSDTPPVVTVEDPDDSDYFYGRVEEESEDDPFLEDPKQDAHDDEDPFADIPLPKDDSEDEDYVFPSNKRTPRRKANDTLTDNARKQDQTYRSRAQGHSYSAQLHAPPPAMIPKLDGPHPTFHGGEGAPEEPRVAAAIAAPNAPPGLLDSSDEKPQGPGNSRRRQRLHPRQVKAASQTPDPAGPSTAPINTAPLPRASTTQDIHPQDRLERALRLQKTVTSLREETRSAEVKYEEAANNPRVMRDPRTRKRRLAKLEEMREKLRQAVEEQAQFQQRYGTGLSVGIQSHEDQGTTKLMTASTASTALALSSTAPLSLHAPSQLQRLEEEVNKLQRYIHGLRRKVAHCQAQLDDVEANPEKFEDKRAGFKAGRATRLQNAQYNLSYNIEKLEGQERLYAEEYERVHGVDPAQDQDGQAGWHQKSGKEAESAAGGHAVAAQTSSRKRKASDLEGAAEEEVKKEEGEEEEEEERQSSLLRLLTPGLH